jgi:hypothetical protein
MSRGGSAAAASSRFTPFLASPRSPPPPPIPSNALVSADPGKLEKMGFKSVSATTLSIGIEQGVCHYGVLQNCKFQHLSESQRLAQQSLAIKCHSCPRLVHVECADRSRTSLAPTKMYCPQHLVSSGEGRLQLHAASSLLVASSTLTFLLCRASYVFSRHPASTC